MDDADLTSHYGVADEAGRLFVGGEPGLELVRTLELLDRYLPPPPADVLDVGGAYASILARRGYRVELIDVVPGHVEQATAVSEAQPEAPFVAKVGDARSVRRHDESVDAVVLLGPLYHLTERKDRVRALREARRVLRPGGVAVAAAISRFASLLDGLARGFLADPTFTGIVERDLQDGQHRNPDPAGRTEWFTTAFFHRPEELSEEVAEAGLEVDSWSAWRARAGCSPNDGPTRRSER